MAGVFISHSDSQTATALERVLRDSFPGAIEVFHTGRAAVGLAAGQPIDTGILSKIRDTQAFIWLATPSSVSASFWMAWELGVASAIEGQPIIPVRCLGLQPGQLPLLQGGRNAPDLGLIDDLRAFLQTIRDLLQFRDHNIAEATASWQIGRSPFWGSRRDRAFSLRVLGARLLIENRTPHRVRLLSVQSQDGNGGQAAVLRQSIALDANERRILESMDIDALEPHSIIYLEWEAEDAGRFFADIYLGGW